MWCTDAMRTTLTALIAVLVLTACNGDATTNSSTTSVGTSESTVSPDTNEAEPQSTTTTSATTTTTDPLAPEGAGCTPGEGDLSDGVWYGGVREFDDRGISFDLACLFANEAATVAAAEDGEESPPPNPFYVRNENDLTRDLAVAPNTPVTWYTSGDPNDEVTGTFPDWIEFLSTQEAYLGIFVTIENGEVAEIREFWTP